MVSAPTRRAQTDRFLGRDRINRAALLAVEQSGNDPPPTSYGCHSPQGPHARPGISDQDAFSALARSQGSAAATGSREQHSQPLRSIRGQTRTAPAPQARRAECGQTPGASQRERGGPAPAEETARHHSPRGNAPRWSEAATVHRVVGLLHHAVDLRLVGPVPLSLHETRNTHDDRELSAGSEPSKPVSGRADDPRRPRCPGRYGGTSSTTRPSTGSCLQCPFEGASCRCTGHQGTGHQGRVRSPRKPWSTRKQEPRPHHLHRLGELD